MLGADRKLVDCRTARSGSECVDGHHDEQKLGVCRTAKGMVKEDRKHRITFGWEVSHLSINSLPIGRSRHPKNKALGFLVDSSR